MYARVAISESAVLTLRLDPKLKKQLERLSKSMRRSRSFVAAEATRGFVALNGWQIEEIKKENEEADRGEFATEAEVEKSLKRWTRRVRVRWLRAALSNLDAEAD
jgi:predicted transcriptional regulator